MRIVAFSVAYVPLYARLGKPVGSYLNVNTLTPTLWDDMLREVRRREPASVREWFRDLSAGTIDAGVLEVRAVNDAQVRYLERHCRSLFTGAAQAVTNRLVSTVFVCEPGGTIVQPTLKVDETGLRPDMTFDTLILGDCNRMAAAAAHVVAERRGEVYNPLYIHGPADTGKTHLLNALGHLAASMSDADVRYTTVDRFSHDLIESLEDDRLPRLRGEQDTASVWILDGVEQLAGRARTQEELHRLFNARIAAGRQLVFASRVGPGELYDVEPRLKTRFASGLVVAVDLPCYETRLAMVRAATSARGSAWPDDVLHTIVDRVEGGASRLRDAIDRIEKHAAALQETVSLETVYDALGQDSAREVSLAAILALTAQSFDVPEEEILGKRRSRNVARARQLGLYLARKLTNHTLVEIGSFFGDRDHTAVHHAVGRIEDEQRTSDRFRRTVREMIRTLRHGEGR